MRNNEPLGVRAIQRAAGGSMNTVMEMLASFRKTPIEIPDRIIEIAGDERLGLREEFLKALQSMQRSVDRVVERFDFAYERMLTAAARLEQMSTPEARAEAILLAREAAAKKGEGANNQDIVRLQALVKRLTDDNANLTNKMMLLKAKMWDAGLEDE